jgi:hypothetical protein
MSLTFGIPNEVDVGSILTVAGVYIGVTGNRFQYGSGSNSTLMVSDSGAWLSATAMAGASGALALQTFNSGSLLYQFIESGFGGSGQAVYSTVTGISGIINAELQSTGNQLYILYTGLAGSIVVTNSNLTASGQVFVNLVNAQAALNLLTSGVLQSGAAVALAITGQQAWNAANNNGINLSGALTNTGVVLGAEIAGLSGKVETQLVLVSGFFVSGSYINFDFRSQIPLTINVENQYIPFSSGFGQVPFVLYSITNNAGNPIITSQLSGITTGGFNVVCASAPTTSNYTLSYMATTGYGATAMGGWAGGSTLVIQTMFGYLTGASGYVFTGANGITLINSGSYVFISGTTYEALGTAANTGQVLLGDIAALSGFALGMSGYLASHGSGQTSLQVTGSQIIGIANMYGLGGTLIFTSGGFLFVSGAGAGVGGNVYSVSGNFGSYINFDLRYNIALSSGVESQYIPFTSGFGGVPFVLYSVLNNSGDSILASQVSGITTGGFNVVFSAAPRTANYLLNYMATTGNGFGALGIGTIITGTAGVSYISPSLSYIGNGISFNISSPTGYYTWSGSGTGINATGILPTPSSESGYSFTVKNQSQNGWLVISGNIDCGYPGGSQSMTIYPLGSYSFWSDDHIWNAI